MGQGAGSHAMGYEEAREQAVAVLTNRYAEDSLSESEFEWWLGRLSEADTVGRVQELTARLTAPQAMPASFAPAVVMAPQEGAIVAFMSENKRTGPWTVPHYLTVRGIMSEVHVDLRQARIPYPCVIEVNALMAAVRITVPDGLVVDFDVSSVMASATNQAADANRHDPHAPRITIRGRAVMSEVRVMVKRARN